MICAMSNNNIAVCKTSHMPLLWPLFSNPFKAFDSVRTAAGTRVGVVLDRVLSLPLTETIRSAARPMPRETQN